MILYIEFSHSIVFGKILRNSSITDQFHFVLGPWNATGWPHACHSRSCLPCKIENSCQSSVLTICQWCVCHLSEIALTINHRGYPRKILVKDEHFSETPFCTAGDWTVYTSVPIYCQSVSRQLWRRTGNTAYTAATASAWQPVPEPINAITGMWLSCFAATCDWLRALVHLSQNRLMGYQNRPLHWCSFCYWFIQFDFDSQQVSSD